MNDKSHSRGRNDSKKQDGVPQVTLPLDGEIALDGFVIGFHGSIKGDALRAVFDGLSDMTRQDFIAKMFSDRIMSNPSAECANAATAGPDTDVKPDNGFDDSSRTDNLFPGIVDLGKLKPVLADGPDNESFVDVFATAEVKVDVYVIVGVGKDRRAERQTTYCRNDPALGDYLAAGYGIYELGLGTGRWAAFAPGIRIQPHWVPEQP